MTDVNTAESSPASFAIPTEPGEYATWRQTGELPAEKPVAEKTPGQKPPKAGEAATSEPTSESAPASDTGKGKQESRGERTPKRGGDDAASRLQEILGDLKNAGLSPAELKTFKRELKAAEEHVAPAAVDEPKQPEKPKLEAFDDYSKYEEALEAYHDQMATFRVNKALAEHGRKAAEAKTQADTQKRLADAVTRYGDGSGQIIQDTAKALFNDGKVPAVVKALTNESPHIADVMYVLGSKAGELQSFIDLSKSDPGQAVRKFVLMEKLIADELGAASTKDETGSGESVRDASGKFTATTPAKKTTSAPPPPRESSGRQSAPPDESEGAFNRDDFKAFRDAENAKDIARRNGR